MIVPVFEHHSIRIPSVCFAAVCCAEVQEVVQTQSITSMPTFILYKNGDELQRVVGANQGALENLVSVAAVEAEQCC